MKNRYFLHLAYRGTNYRGYQRQPNIVSVQSTIEDTLTEVLGQPMVLSGCGRTDAGVHASQYFGSIDLEGDWPEDRLDIFNRRLLADISCYEVVAVPAKASCRFDATERRYDYFLHLDKSAGLSGLSSWYPKATTLDSDKIIATLRTIEGKQDFRAFCKTPDRHNTTICELRQAKFFSDASGKYLRFHFAGNRFLRGMIRLLVGNLLLVGSGSMSIDEFTAALHKKQAPDFHNLAAPDGLYLSGIDYDFCRRPNRSPLHSMLEELTK